MNPGSGCCCHRYGKKDYFNYSSASNVADEDEYQ